MSDKTELIQKVENPKELDEFLIAKAKEILEKK